MDETQTRRPPGPVGHRGTRAPRAEANGCGTEAQLSEVNADRETTTDDPMGIAYDQYTKHVQAGGRKATAALRRTRGIVFTPPRVAKLAAETIAIERWRQREIHIVDACCGFGMLALAAVARLAERLGRARSEPGGEGNPTPSAIKLTLIDTDSELLELSTRLLKRATKWCAARGITLETASAQLDLLHDHDELQALIGDARDGRADTILCAPPPINRQGQSAKAISVDKLGRPRSRSGNIATEFCEAIWEAAAPETELVLITPAAWTASSDYALVRERARAELDVTHLVTFRSRHSIWGAQEIRGHTMIWRAPYGHQTNGGSDPAPNPNSRSRRTETARSTRAGRTTSTAKRNG